jgi:hypothetical protein
MMKITDDGRVVWMEEQGKVDPRVLSNSVQKQKSSVVP